jgi:hypothetical protein
MSENCLDEANSASAALSKIAREKIYMDPPV